MCYTREGVDSPPRHRTNTTFVSLFCDAVTVWGLIMSHDRTTHSVISGAAVRLCDTTEPYLQYMPGEGLTIKMYRDAHLTHLNMTQKYGKQKIFNPDVFVSIFCLL